MFFTMECMFQKLWSGFTTATLVVSALGIAAPSHANQPGESDEGATAKVSQAETSSEAVASTAINPGSVTESSTPSLPGAAAADVATSSGVPASEATKVGEYQSQESSRPAIASIHAHTLNGRQAVTLYVRGIPVLTFLGGRTAESHATREVQSTAQSSNALASQEKLPTPSVASSASQQSSSGASNSADPAWRAAAVAAQINQFQQDGIDATTITARWESARQRYVIRVGQQELVELNSNTVLPENAEAGAEEVLQATNRLRRLLGNAPALADVANRPRLTQQISFGTIAARLQGLASWYGPGFHGAMSASGEIFNQNALTAAHRTLPFGTQVRVTNLQTGRSVVVRINDRGPFTGGRVIDLSAAAASAIGLISAGVAPVSLEVMQTAYQR